MPKKITLRVDDKLYDMFKLEIFSYENKKAQGLYNNN